MRERREVENFCDILNRWALRDLGFVGQWWTWERGKLVETRVPRGSIDLLLRLLGHKCIL